MVKTFWVVVAWLLIPLWAQAATITAQFDRNPVAVGDPVTLVFSVEGVASDDPDFSPLKQHFEVVGQSQSTSAQYTNGVGSTRTEWRLNLIPNSTGALKVPPIAFGSDHSPALELQVQDQPPPSSANGAAPNGDIFVELEAQPTQPRVQQQTLIIQRLFHLQDLPDQASLSHPTITSGKGMLQPLGNATRTTMQRNGRNYQVTERRYALFPQQSGELVLGRTQFEGIVLDPNTNPMDFFSGGGQQVRRTSQPLKLTVQAQAAGYTGKAWLPAKSLSLNAHWQTPPDKLRAGEPVTLTLAIVADGLMAEQLPKLEVQAPAGIKAYTSQPEVRNETRAGGVIGVRQENWVIVAPYNGEYELPALSLDWWNITTGKQETVTTPPVKLVVSGGQAAPANAAPPASSIETPQPAASKPATPAAPSSGTPWSWLAAWLLGIWVSITLGWVLWRKFKPTKIQPASGQPLVKTAKGAALQQLEQACRRGEPQAAQAALLNWMETDLHIVPPLLSSLRAQANVPLQTAIDELNAAIYRRGNSPWDGMALWGAVQRFNARPDSPSRKAGLSELYPD